MPVFVCFITCFFMDGIVNIVVLLYYKLLKTVNEDIKTQKGSDLVILVF